jgi:hypothetical protein
MKTPRRDPPTQPGTVTPNDGRAGPAPDSAHPTGPSPPFETPADKVKADARGQFAKGNVVPNRDGHHSAHPVVLSGDGDATTGNGHGRDRDTSEG